MKLFENSTACSVNPDQHRQAGFQRRCTINTLEILIVLYCIVWMDYNVCKMRVFRLCLKMSTAAGKSCV